MTLLRLSEGTLPQKKRPDPLASWNPQRQHAYGLSGALPTVHLLLDASGSMSAHRQDLLQGVNNIFLLLKRLLHPLSPVHCWGFNMHVFPLVRGKIGSLPFLAHREYRPEGGTRLFQALSTLVQGVDTPGQQVLITMTDGIDTQEVVGQNTVTSEIVHTLLRDRQDDGWLCVYLGAFPEALAQGLACGFTEGNCLVFPSYAMAEAFQQLEKSLQKFFQAPAAQQKRLAQHGVFAPDTPS